MSKNEVTLSREEFRKLALEVISNGDFVTQAKVEDPNIAITIMLTGIPFVHEIADKIFGKEDKNNGAE